MNLGGHKPLFQIVGGTAKVACPAPEQEAVAAVEDDILTLHREYWQ